MGKAERTNPMAQWKKTEGVTIYDCYDQFGRQIGPGDYILLPGHGAVVWRVTQTRPIMDPKVPPGIVELVCAAVTQVGLQGGVPLSGVIKVRDALEYMTPEQLEQYKQETRAGDDASSAGRSDTPQGGEPAQVGQGQGAEGEGHGTAAEPPPLPEFGDHNKSRIILP